MDRRVDGTRREREERREKERRKEDHINIWLEIKVQSCYYDDVHILELLGSDAQWHHHTIYRVKHLGIVVRVCFNLSDSDKHNHYLVRQTGWVTPGPGATHLTPFLLFAVQVNRFLQIDLHVIVRHHDLKNKYLEAIGQLLQNYVWPNSSKCIQLCRNLMTRKMNSVCLWM